MTPTDRQTDIASYRVACTRLKTKICFCFCQRSFLLWKKRVFFQLLFFLQSKLHILFFNSRKIYFYPLVEIRFSIWQLDSIESTSTTFTLKAYCSSLFIQKASANQFTGNLYCISKYWLHKNHFDWDNDEKQGKFDQKSQHFIAKRVTKSSKLCK